MIVEFFAVAVPVALAVTAWLFVATVRLTSDRAAAFGQALLPRTVVYRRLARQIREQNGR